MVNINSLIGTQDNEGRVNCTDWSKLEDIKFNIGEIVYAFTAKKYLKDVEGLCAPRLNFVQTPPGEEAFWVLGSAFVSRFYTVFDYGQERIGFAEAIST